MVLICLLQKYTENKIVRAGPAQPAQLDGMHQISFQKPTKWLTFARLRNESGFKKELIMI